jgi:beta-N-acetylhexosaminidase
MLVIGIADKQLGAAEREWILAPEVSGVILFTRNFADRAQLVALIAAIRQLRPGPFLLCIDQEGGPVQRLRDEFTRLPALARLGERYDIDAEAAVTQTEEHAWLMASEMRALDIDLSFAPVLDLKRGNRAIGERAFHTAPNVVSELGLAYLRGMRLAGMAATVKHFPGHGSVVEDTHFENARDQRTLQMMTESDLPPFADAFEHGAEAVMMAHVVYPLIDERPAGYSSVWIEQILRRQMGFQGVVFSDDIGMAAAESAGGVAARISAHLHAGCDLVLVCSPSLVAESIAAVRGQAPFDPERVAALQGRVAQTAADLADNPQYLLFRARLEALNGATA